MLKIKSQMNFMFSLMRGAVDERFVIPFLDKWFHTLSDARENSPGIFLHFGENILF
jgi:hypothetical protein